MGFHLSVTNDYLDVWDEYHCRCSHNPLHPSDQPSTQQIRVVTWDLSANGVMSRHQFLGRNWLWDRKFSPFLTKACKARLPHPLRRLYEKHKTHFPSCHRHTSAKLLPSLCTIKLSPWALPTTWLSHYLFDPVMNAKPTNIFSRKRGKMFIWNT
jgi:hypothetical protein